MASVGSATLNVTLTGDLSAIARALTLLTEALDSHGHVWTEGEKAACREATDILADPDRRIVKRGAAPVKYGPAELIWDVLAIVCDWTVSRRLTNWPEGWFHRSCCNGWMLFCNRHRLWRL